MNIQSCVCVTPWVWRGFYWIQGTLYEIADQTYCQDTVLELCWQHWKWEITQISIWEEDNQQCNLSVRLHHVCYIINTTYIYSTIHVFIISLSMFPTNSRKTNPVKPFTLLHFLPYALATTKMNYCQSLKNIFSRI